MTVVRHCCAPLWAQFVVCGRDVPGFFGGPSPQLPSLALCRLSVSRWDVHCAMCIHLRFPAVFVREAKECGIERKGMTPNTMRSFGVHRHTAMHKDIRITCAVYIFGKPGEKEEPLPLRRRMGCMHHWRRQRKLKTHKNSASKERPGASEYTQIY